MTKRVLTVGGAQMGPVMRADSKAATVARMVDLMRQAHARSCDLVVFPELALTTFFPRWFIEDQAELDSFYEFTMPSAVTQPLFDAARELQVGFHLGYAEVDGEHRFNTAILVDKAGEIVAKYRKIHLPGHAEFDPEREFQHLEKRYFEVGNLGFPVWETMGGKLGMLICNDRRWPEAFRMLGLQDVELVVIGYNTPTLNGQTFEPPHLRIHHNLLTMQAGAYQNGAWVCGVAKAGYEDGVHMMGSSAIVTPNGEIAALASTLEDELIVADCDLDAGAYIKTNIFNFAAHRRTEHYGLIVETTGTVPPRGT
ncbi:MAG: N-carbamoyl-D-amino-acid hydrolase [Rhodospirillaceae bacterium]|jgi:N-carbamoyl-D-amino-acid hydrolase|nr:N-carbamoyl-D-amino-acid hydrolase [Rhodospirillaceae bacterium]MBT6511223.1 N-carbamoyl-D-amino-acid hydrolase [Rhodospirillaceae bacterium]MBT7614301.1 N-carbamoyl-D-amino-acid hydrolase [Rhodospirillaceae bacterium]MBT7648893.1 N-carbamoyl-D-amino-acid hydrolase [Rhodospirillaceae bacterium]